MRVLVCPADMAGCGYYRLLFAAEHLRSLGHDIVIQEAGQENAGFDVHWIGDQIVDIDLRYEGIDVIVLQRLSHDWYRRVVPLMRSKGIAVVIDMDDDLSNIHRDNVAYWNYHPRTKTPNSWKYATEICNEATMVTVSTKSLAPIYARHKRVHVIDNYVPERYLHIIPMPEPEPVFGWAGTVQSHPADLQVCGRAIQTLIDQGHKFRIVGPSQKVKENLRLKEQPECTGGTDMFSWSSKLCQLSVGMAPLEVSAFNSSKSRLKNLEFNAVGVPYVASPRQEYRRYHKESGGAGFLAETPKEWVNHISRLMTDDILRKELGEQGRAFAATQTIEQHSWRWLEAWTQAYEIQRAGK